MIDAGLVFARFLHYSASLVLFGVALFPLYTYPRRKVDGIRGRERLLAICWVLSIVVLVSGALWFASVATSMTDAEMSWETARFVLTETSYGAICLVRLCTLAGVIFVLALVTFDPSRRLGPVSAVLGGVLVASLAGTGHAQAEEGPIRLGHMLADALHLIGAGAWLGGLVVLFYLTARSLHPDSSELGRSEACNAAHRFSAMGYLAVATIVGTGIVNSWFLVNPLTNLIKTEYGLLLLVKVTLFMIMVGLAGANRFLVLPSLTDPAGADGAASLRRLRLHILLEQCLGFAIILIVGLLGTMEPAIGGTH